MKRSLLFCLICLGTEIYAATVSDAGGWAKPWQNCMAQEIQQVLRSLPTQTSFNEFQTVGVDYSTWKGLSYTADLRNPQGRTIRAQFEGLTGAIYEFDIDKRATVSKHQCAVDTRDYNDTTVLLVRDLETGKVLLQKYGTLGPRPEIKLERRGARFE